jgi:tRNA threonylcarbamoyladenosine modification (KEOPS) complex  Pcc1 subunit
VARFTAEITLPIVAKGLLESEYAGRSRVKITTTKSSTTVRIESDGLSSLKAALNSALRDLTVVEAASKAAKA